MSLRFRRIKNSRAVSEVVGAVLILLITIAMFSVVIIWVVSYPLPTAKYHSDFEATLESKYVNITHLSGETLTEATSSYISVTVDDISQTYTFSDGGVGTDFSVGETWSKSIDSITSSSSVNVLVIAAREIIYQETLRGAYGTSNPIIAFAVAKPSTVPADGATSFKICAYVIDPDNDVAEVYANLSEVGRGLCSITGSDGIFESSSLTIPTDASLGMYLFKINATDANNNIATGYVSLKVISPSVLEGGGFWGASSGDSDQGFMITNALNSTEDIRIFNQTDTIWVKVGSSALRNVRLRNLFDLKDTNGSTLTPPSSTSAFTYYGYEGGFYFYAYSFSVQNISGMTGDGGVYYVYIELKDYGNHVFITDATILIKDIYGNIPSYGIINTYSDSACIQECRTFNSTTFIYIKIFTKTTGLASSATISDVEIRDFFAGTQIKKAPGNTPVSNISIVSGNYSLSINLLNASQDPWLYPGSNAYTLSISTFLDADEYYESISTQVIVIAPKTLLDIVAGIDELTNPAWGTKEYSYFYSNDNLWSETVIDNIGISPTKYTYKVALGDMDGDTDLDIVASVAAGSPLNYYLYLYENLGNNWAGDTVNYRTTIDDTVTGTLGGRVNSIELGDVDGDNDLDIVVGTDNKNVFVYRNDGNWTQSIVSAGDDVYTIALGDLDGNETLDIAVGRGSGKISVFLNKGNGTFWGGPATSTDYYANAEWISEGNISGGSYLNTNASDNVYENLTETLTTIIGTTTNDNATGDVPVLGTRTNTYTATFVDAGIYEKIKEVTDSSINKIDHRWTIALTSGGESWVFSVEAKRELGSQGDDNFTFYYSTTGTFTGEEVTMLTVTTTSSDIYYNYTFPNGSLAGVSTIYIRALDTNRNSTDDAGNEQDTLSIDRMYITTAQQNSTYSSLTHVWRIPSITAGEASYSFYVEANHTSNSENDNFTFQNSTDNSTWYTMLNVTKTTDDNSLDSYSFTVALSGTIYIRVIDVDSTSGYTVNDTLYVDKMFIRSMSVETGSINITAGSNNTLSLAIADIDNDGDNDIISGDSSGKVYQCLNSGTGTSWTNTQVGDAGSAVNGLGIGKLAGDITSKRDIAVGTSDGKIYVFSNDGSWTRATVDASVGSQVNGLVVGDVYGDGDDDIVIGCSGGYVYYYDNINPSSNAWDKIEVDSVDVVVYAVDAGDVSG